MKFQLIEPKNNFYSSKTVEETMIIPQFVDNVEKLKNYKSMIVDNGVFEMFHSNQLDKDDYDKQIQEAFLFFKKVKATFPDKKIYFVLPDFPFDCFKTMLQTTKFLFKALKIRGVKTDDFIGVIQGRNAEEVHNICDFYKEVSIKIVAIPNKLRKYFYDITENVVDFVLNYFKPDSIHNFGFELEDVYNNSFWGCRSFDSTYPLKIHFQGRKFGDDVSRERDYFERKINAKTTQNVIFEFRRWLNGKERDFEVRRNVQKISKR